MGTRINVMLDHPLDDYRDRQELLRRLSSALPEALAVQQYWAGVDEAGANAGHELTEWKADPELARFAYHSYTGPGSIWVKILRHTALIHTGGRWRGFLSIPELHQVHLTAFRAIASALGATTMAFYPGCTDELTDLFYEDRSLEENIYFLKTFLGPPQPSVESISADVSAATDHDVPMVWYISRLVSPSEA